MNKKLVINYASSHKLNVRHIYDEQLLIVAKQPLNTNMFIVDYICILGHRSFVAAELTSILPGPVICPGIDLIARYLKRNKKKI